MKLEYERREKCSISKENSPAAVQPTANEKRDRERERESCMYSCGGGKHPDIDASNNLTELSMGLTACEKEHRSTDWCAHTVYYGIETAESRHQDHPWRKQH